MAILARLPWLLAALVVSVGAVTWAVSVRRAELASLAAGLFALLLILGGLTANRSLWRLPVERITPTAAPIAGARNATLLALGYAWGAATLAAVYALGGVVWQHGYQYAAGMALIAAGIAVYARGLSGTDSGLRAPRAQLLAHRLTILHAMAAAAGLGFLFLSGKLKSPRGDWAANIVFLMGGTAILALSVIAAVTQHRLSRRA